MHVQRDRDHLRDANKIQEEIFKETQDWRFLFFCVQGFKKPIVRVLQNGRGNGTAKAQEENEPQKVHEDGIDGFVQIAYFSFCIRRAAHDFRVWPSVDDQTKRAFRVFQFAFAQQDVLFVDIFRPASNRFEMVRWPIVVQGRKTFVVRCVDLQRLALTSQEKFDITMLCDDSCYFYIVLFHVY